MMSAGASISSSNSLGGGNTSSEEDGNSKVVKGFITSKMLQSLLHFYAEVWLITVLLLVLCRLLEKIIKFAGTSLLDIHINLNHISIHLVKKNLSLNSLNN